MISHHPVPDGFARSVSLHDDPHILIVDDDPALLQALPALLELRVPGANIAIADSGEAALGHLKTTAYDVMFCDVKMPGLNGLSLIHLAKVLRPLTPIICISGHGDSALPLQALEAGAYDFLHKPFDRHAVVLAVHRGIETHRLRQQVPWVPLPPTLHEHERTLLTVQHLPVSCALEQLRDLFTSFGTILWLRLVADANHHAWCVGYVQMGTAEQASAARQHLHGSRMGDQVLTITLNGQPIMNARETEPKAAYPPS